MFKRIDRSKFLIRILQRMSTLLANNRGLPIVVGIVMVAIAFIIQLIYLFSPTPALALLHAIFHHLGIILALLGLLLSYPLAE